MLIFAILSKKKQNIFLYNWYEASTNSYRIVEYTFIILVLSYKACYLLTVMEGGGEGGKSESLAKMRTGFEDE